MTRYVVLRLYSMGLTLVGLSVLVFLMLRLIPGTVVEQMIGADAIVSPAMVAELTRFFGLDQPWWLQYGRWIAEIGHGNLGTSWRTGKSVLSLIVERLPVTLELTALSVAFALLLGIPAGIVSATRRDQAVDNVTRVGTLLGLSIPVFWQGTMLDRKSTRLNSSHSQISYAVFCLKKKKQPSERVARARYESLATGNRTRPCSACRHRQWLGHTAQNTCRRRRDRSATADLPLENTG